MKRLFSLTRALVARKRKIFALFFALAASIGLSWATTYVTITKNDFPSWDTSFTKDGVTVSAGNIDGDEGNLQFGGSFSTTLGNFTKIEVNAQSVNVSGEGWSGFDNPTWTGNASSVSFSGDIMGMGMGVTTLKFTIEEAAPTITVGALEHGSVVASPTSAEAGATITLTATPEAGYKLNTIEATYFGAANETLSVKDKKNVGRGITAEYNKSNYLYVSSYDGAYNLTVSTNDGTNLIRKIEIEFYGPGVNDARTNSMLSSDHGSWAFEDGDPCTKATINNINAVSVVLSGSGVGMNKAWFPKTMKVYYDGDVLIDLTDTENANVKTFTMVDKAVDVFAEFIPTGSCGENLTWEYSPSTGALVISGTGAMSDYDNDMNKAPWYAYRESISSITLSDGLTYIGKHAFRECNNFTQLVVPNSVTEIGNTAFQDCSKLWNLTLPNTLEKIGGAAFERTKISNFTIPEGVTSLDGYVFGECTSLYSVNIHAGVTSLTGNVFYNCTNLNTIYSYVKNPVAITGAVFEGVNKANCKLYVPFTSMAAYQAADEWKDFFIKPIPGTAPTLYLDIDGSSATLIYGYPEDGKPAYNEEYTRWDNLDYDDRDENLKTITIDASCRENVMTSFKNLFQYFQAVETIRNMAYLSTVNVTNMQSMFNYCKKLTELDLHTFNTAKVTNMETMFSDCSELVTLDISSFNTSNVTSMYYMFTYDDKLEHIYVGDGWNTDNVTKHERMFQYCGKLPNYNYNYLDKTKAHTGDGGYLTALTQIGAWESGDCDVILYSNGRMSVTKKAGNGNGAMADYANKDAQPWADYRNVVTKLDIEDGVKEIGTCAFYDFREMTQLNISEGVTAIHENAFRNGKKLTTLILPSTLRVLGDEADAFTGCPITDIYLTAHPARLTWNEDNDDFIYSYSNPDVHKTTVCHVPANLADAYVAKFITGVEADKQPNVTFEGGMPAVDMITPEDVIALINEIGEVAYTAECKAKIDAAREAYDGLVDEDKAQVNNLTTLTQAEDAYAQLLAQAVAAVKAQIEALPATPLTPENTKLSEYNKVKAAREAYDALSDEEKAAVDNYDKLTAAEAAFAAIPSVGSETVITWDKNTGIEKISGTTTSPAYEGITISIKGGGFSPEDDMLRFNIAGLGLSFEFANTLGGNFQKIVISSTNAMPSTPLAGMGEGWAASSGNKIATWTGDAATVKIWDGLTATSYWDVNTIQFTLGATVSATEAAQAAKDLIDAIPQPVVYTPECKEAIKAAREALDALGANASLLDDADLQKLTDAETAYAQLLAQAVAAVKAAIDAVPATPLTDATKKLSEYNKVKAAREAYDALSDEEKAAVDNYSKLTDAEAAFAAIGGGGSAPDGALSGKFTINADGDQIAFSKGNLQATTTDLGANWTWGFAANQWNYLGIAVANSKINGNGTVSENGTVDLFGWSTAATYYGINNSYKAVDYIGDFVDWGPNMGAGWRTLTKDEWNYLIENNTKGRATVNDKNGYIFLPNDWSGPAFTPNPDNFTTNVYSGDDWTAMENAGAVFLPSGPARNGTYALIANDAKYCSSTSLNNDTSYVFTIYYNQSQSACTGTNRAYGCMVRLVTAGGASPIADAQAAKDLIDAIPQQVVYTPECGAAIKAAREAVDALGENASLLDDADLNKLTQAEAAYAQLLAQAVAAVKEQIEALPDTPLTDATKKLSEYNKVKAAREAYDALSDEEKAAVDNYSKLTDAEAAFAAISGGTKPVDIVWDINTGINEVAINTTSPAYEGITVTTGKGNRFYQTTTDPIMLRFFFSGGAGRYAFAKEDGSHFTKVVLISSVKMSDWLINPSRIGTDWVVSDEDKKATWIGDADTVKIWDGASATAWVDVDSIVFTVNATASPLADAQAALDKINAIPSPVVVSDECKAKIDAAREAVTALGENASLLDDADIDKLAKAEADFALLIKDATAVVAKIDAIGEVTFSPECKAKIVDAREAYDALSDELKPYVSNLTTLTAAEATYEAARPFATVTTVPAAVEALQYTGAAQTLITAGVAEHGTVLYSLDGENYSTELPTALLAGAYTIYYKVQATDDYKDVAPVTVTATIAYNYPATYSLFGIPEGWSVKVNDEEVAVVNGAVKNIAANDRFDIMPVKPEDVKLVEVVPYLLDLATVTDSVIYLMNGDSITGTANGNISIVIVPDAKVYFKDVNLTNTGGHPAVLCGGNAEMVVVGENSITCTTEGEYGIRTAGAGTTLTVSGDKTLLNATIDPNGGTVNQ